MNDKIKELAEQTGIYLIPNSKPISIGGSVTDLEKFAELIIQECIDVIKDSDAECRDEWDYAERDLVGLIHKYFGVE